MPSPEPQALADRAPNLPVQLRARPLAFDTYRENLVVLSRDCMALRPERLVGARRVEIRANGTRLLASLIISDDARQVAANEAGLTQPLMRRLAVTAGTPVEVRPAAPPPSADALHAKIAGESLGEADYEAIARDLGRHLWSDMEIAAFLVACAGFMTEEETLAFTRGMVLAGRRLSWPRPLIVDKHCIGGVPGNRTSLIVTPIVAAHGLWMPKTSSRAITSPAGTADTMEVFARVDLDEGQMRAVVEQCGACIAWGGRVNLSPADDVLISVERPLSIDTPEQMVASILSKKLAAGATHLVLDLPVGPTAKVRSLREALRLRKLFEYVAARTGLGLDVVITDAAEPIGRGVGPVLEARDVAGVLDGRADAPADLREKALRLAGRVLDQDPGLKGGAGFERARELLESGAARRKFDEICAAQGPSPVDARLGSLVQEIRAPHGGWVSAIDCLRIARLARLAGAPTDAGAGLDLLSKTGARVEKGDPLYRIHGVESSDFALAVAAAEADCGVVVQP